MQKGKKPLYIDVYDKLFKQIMDGMFPVDTKLPTETELAKMHGISRMTLRQALALLQDDGLIKSIHGKGNFISESKSINSINTAIGLEKIGNPIYKCFTDEIDDVELNFRLDLESEYTKKVLNRKVAAVVAFERWYKSNDQVVAYSFTFMAIETVSDLGLDLQDEQQMLDLLERKVYEMATSSTIEIKHTSSISSLSQKYKIEQDEDCDLLLESVYVNDQYPIVFNKYYIPKQFSQIKIVASK